jgi:hypothetical protein
MYHFIVHFKSILPSHLFIVSFISFIFLNIIENLYHYSIGRHSNENLKFTMPTKKDWIQIMSVMFIFGLLQALFTSFLNKREYR